ncbi:MAG: hypothetical protein FD162_2139 [Rhodobacteraceae bacterium]|nr:MAG: hypothetical protein FD162_2139 [Paracoccaceae bacterium]
MTNEITHGHLLPCLCGAGKPDQGWFGYGAGRETHHVQCICGDGTTDSTEDGAAAKWNALVRAKALASERRAAAIIWGAQHA